MFKIEIYIGSPNSTHRINRAYLNQVKRWSNSFFAAGYTLIRGRGFWNGGSEESLVLTAYTLKTEDLGKELKALAKTLNQKSILYSVSVCEVRTTGSNPGSGGENEE